MWKSPRVLEMSVVHLMAESEALRLIVALDDCFDATFTRTTRIYDDRFGVGVRGRLANELQHQLVTGLDVLPVPRNLKRSALERQAITCAFATCLPVELLGSFVAGRALLSKCSGSNECQRRSTVVETHIESSDKE